MSRKPNHIKSLLPVIAYIYVLFIAARVKKNIQRTLAAASPLSLEQGVCEEYNRRLKVVIERLIPVAFRNQRGYDSNHVDYFLLIRLNLNFLYY